MFLKVLVIIIMRFDENNVSVPKYYINFRRVKGGVHGSPSIFGLLFIKLEKIKEHNLY